MGAIPRAVKRLSYRGSGAKYVRANPRAPKGSGLCERGEPFRLRRERVPPCQVPVYIGFIANFRTLSVDASRDRERRGHPSLRPSPLGNFSDFDYGANNDNIAIIGRESSVTLRFLHCVNIMQ